MAYQRKDSWYRKAKQEGYRSRAAYKLEELHLKLKLFTPGMRVVDLGCAPGGWLQVAAKWIGKKGLLVGIDRFETQPLADARILTMTGDITQPSSIENLQKNLGKPADLVLSDMAPDTTGVGFADHANSVELVYIAGRVAEKLLVTGGRLVAKVFDGPDMKHLTEKLSQNYSNIQRIHLKSTRKGSRELYLVAKKNT